MITAKPLAGLSQTYFAQDLKLTCRRSTCAAALIARACSWARNLMSVVTFCIWVWRDIVTLLVLLYAVVTWLSISVTVLRKLTPSLKKKKNSWAVCWVFVAWNKFINICKWLQDFIIVLWMTCIEVMWNFSPSFEHRGAQRTKDGLSSHQHMSITV